VTVISISIPDELLRKLDSYMELKGYASRSEFIRELIREHLEAAEALDPGAKVTAILVVLTDHDESLSVDEKVVRLIHSYQPLIKAFYHQLLSGNLCLNIAIVTGEAGVISRLVRSLRSLRGVKNVWSLHIH
jgi:CopG family nickel-responsive transcriptional regulator